MFTVYGQRQDDFICKGRGVVVFNPNQLFKLSTIENRDCKWLLENSDLVGIVRSSCYRLYYESRCYCGWFVHISG